MKAQLAVRCYRIMKRIKIQNRIFEVFIYFVDGNKFEKTEI